MMNISAERERDLQIVGKLLPNEASRLLRVEEQREREREELIGYKEYLDANYKELEKSSNDLNNLLDTLIENKQLSTFQIVDGVVEKVLELLAERGVRDYDHSDFDEPPEKWVPYVTAKTKKPPSFIHDVYGEFRGLTRADIREIDPELGVAYDNWVSKGGAFPENFSLPDKSGTGLETPNPYQRYIYQRVNAGVVQKTRKSN